VLNLISSFGLKFLFNRTLTRRNETHLDGFSKIFSFSLLLNDFTIDLASGDVVVSAESDVEVSLVIAQVKVDLAAIVEDVDFTWYY